MNKFISILLLLIVTSTKGQELKNLDNFIEKPQGSNGYFIIFGPLGCSSCYKELAAFLQPKVDSSVYFLSICINEPLIMRNTMNELHSDYNISYDRIYFISNESALVNKKESVTQQYPKLLVITKLKNIQIYNYSYMFNEKGLKKKRIKKILKE